MTDPLDKIAEKIQSCRICEAKYDHGIHKPASMKRGGVSKIIIVGEAPGDAAITNNLAFSGNSFTNLHKWFQYAGFQGTKDDLRSVLYLTSVIKCKVGTNKPTQVMDAYRYCQNHLYEQIKIMNNPYVITLGKSAYNCLVKDLGVNYADDIGRFFGPEDTKARLIDLYTSRGVLVLPHPSGMNRMVNDSEVRTKIKAGLTPIVKEVIS